EDVRAALQLGIDPAPRLELEGAGAGAGNLLAGYAVRLQQVAGRPGFFGGAGDRPLPLVPGPQMLGRAVIGLEPAEFEMRQIHDPAGEVERRLARLDAAAVAAHVDLDIDR